MITLRKLAGLAEGTRGRKLLTLLNEDHDPVYAAGVVEMARSLLGDSPQDLCPPSPRDRGLLRQRLALHLGISAADWDLQAPPDREGDVRRFPFHAWLDDLRSPFNVGSTVRTAEAYGFSSVWHSLATPGLDHPRTLRTSMGTEVFIEVASKDLGALKEQWAGPVFALELGGTPVDQFRFPSEGLVLIGGEELGLSPEALAWADTSLGRVSLPLYGRKASLNVGVAFGILAAAWVGATVN